MRVKINKAVKLFFGNSSLEMVYLEAISNSLDAHSSKIEIKLRAQDYSQPETLIIEIVDNGVGFTDNRFQKFSNLLDVEETTHKGLGRLVYLCYFENIEVSSYFDSNKQRTFTFNEGFDGESKVISLQENHPSGTQLLLKKYTLSRLSQHAFIQPTYLKTKILSEFYSRLYKLKQKGENVEISINAVINGKSAEEKLFSNELPEMTMLPVPNVLELFETMELHYNIQETPLEKTSVITAISVDNRTFNLDIIAEENLPIGFKLVFLLISDSFNGKADAARQSLTLSDVEMQTIKKTFRFYINKIIEENLPQISIKNTEKKKRLENQFPHLIGYFDEDNIGYGSQIDIIKKAQDRFFRAQREILGANSLTEDQFKTSLELSSRALTEYILFRQIIIQKLKGIDRNNVEADIHNLLVPMKQKYEKELVNHDLYRNNIWVLDDKYMTYDTLLSDKEMTEVIDVITEGEVKIKDDDRPDIAIVFSGNPKENKKVDVVIIELKKKGLSSELNSIIEVQLENRARKLMKYYNQSIQQIWFYGIVELNKDFELHLASEYHSLFSNGKVYYKPKEVVMQINPKISVPVGIYIMDLDAIVEDADARNLTFLNLIKSKFMKKDNKGDGLFS